jgi:hypothetical protein
MLEHERIVVKGMPRSSAPAIPDVSDDLFALVRLSFSTPRRRIADRTSDGSGPRTPAAAVYAYAFFPERPSDAEPVRSAGGSPPISGTV